MNKIQLSEKTGFPNSWESLTKKELIYLVKLWRLLITRNDLSLIDIKRQFVSQVFSWRGIRREHSIDYLILVNEVAATLDWAISYDEEKNLVIINYDCIECQIPQFSGLKGPSSYGEDLSFGEFKYLLVLFNAIGNGQDVENNLYRLARTLYRKRDKETGRRIPFNDNIYEAKGPKHIPEYIAYYAYLWFAAFCKYLMDGVFIIGGHEVNFSCIFGGDGGGDKSLGMDSILFSIAESHVFGAIKDVEQTQLFRVLLKLVDDKNKSDELRKQLKQ